MEPALQGATGTQISRRQDESPGDEPEACAEALARQAGRFPDPDIVFSALEAGQIGVWSWDTGSDRITWSANIAEICGFDAGHHDSTLAAFGADIHPDDRNAIRSMIEDVCRSRKSRYLQFRMSPRADGERWLEIVASVTEMSDGRLHLFGTCREASHRAKVHRELRARASQQEAVARLGERALMESELQAFLDDCVSTVATILDADLVQILELVPGDAELLLRAGIGWQARRVGSALVSTGRESQAGFTLASGGPVLVEQLESESRFTGEPLLREHGVVSGLTVPIAGRDGRSYGVLGAHRTHRQRFSELDVSFLGAVANVLASAIQRNHMNQRQDLMIRELRHRSGNLFAQLLALFSQTARSSRNMAELVPKFEARVMALAHAHRLLTESGWTTASLRDVLHTLLATYRDRVSITGNDIMLAPDPIFGLGMAVHELATNAGKYGSLSVKSGHVELSWAVERTAQGPTLVVDWKERNGPALRRHAARGFGSKLIDAVIERQLNGEVKRSFGKEGLEAHLIIPLPGERRRSMAAAEAG